MSDLIREPGQWRGPRPKGELRMKVVGPPLASRRPGWPTVTGWREIPDEPERQWVQVQVAVDPADREPETIAPARSYKPDDRVWVWRLDGWWQGYVIHADGGVALVRYLAPGVLGWVLDQVTTADLMARDGTDVPPPMRRAAPHP